ncbi:hypothetical protein GGR88_000846 [Sphingomonas jejuensis]|uniref:EamA-like transporter family protein n=1 Tax=Sphingomonas jejuensis TaxID=904715 RepID=A0ABX0XJ60_9SPHN|nr:hypothetical protein [Sphingomonas jejuensis]NJC33372.1 hypothetical protein [Sphingomonas jejuensis]
MISVIVVAAATWGVTGPLLRWQVGSRIGASTTVPALLTWLVLIITYVDWNATAPDARGWQLVIVLFSFIISLVATLPALCVAWMIEGRWGHAAP